MLVSQLQSRIQDTPIASERRSTPPDPTVREWLLRRIRWEVRLEALERRLPRPDVKRESTLAPARSPGWGEETMTNFATP